MSRQIFTLFTLVAALGMALPVASMAQRREISSRELSTSPAVTFFYHAPVPLDVIAVHFPADGQRSVADMTLEVRNDSDRDVVSAKFYLVMSEKGESPAGFRFIFNAERTGGILRVGEKTMVSIPAGENSTAMLPQNRGDGFVAKLILVHASFADGSEYFSPFPLER
jgi:hypothetical protein